MILLVSVISGVIVVAVRPPSHIAKPIPAKWTLGKCTPATAIALFELFGSVGIVHSIDMSESLFTKSVTTHYDPKKVISNSSSVQGYPGGSIVGGIGWFASVYDPA